MFTTPPFSLAAHTQHLSYWVVIRTLVLVLLGLACLCCHWYGVISLPYTPILSTLGLMSLVNWLTFMRLKQPLAVTALEFLIQLLIDIILLGAIFYFSGGANNPFISYFLVPICIAAATLSGRATQVVASVAMLSYSLLLFFHIPLPILSPHHVQLHQPLSPHVLGMWLNFFISAALIAYFVVRMARDLRAQAAQLNRQREDGLRDEQLLAVATLAAGTAHELGTPLATMKLLIGELCAEHQQAELQQDLQLLNQQLERCAGILRKLVHKAEQSKDGQAVEQSLRTYCLGLVDDWQLMRPEVSARIQIDSQLPEVSCYFHPTIAQALINLLNNAADADPHHLAITIRWDLQRLFWEIADQGPGIPAEINPYLGKKILAPKHQGMGLGLLLTQATLSRYGGLVQYRPGTPKGTITLVSLPLKTAS